MRVARPTTITDKTLNRIILIAGLGLLIGIPAFIGFYFLDRHVTPAPSVAEQHIATAEAQVKANPTDGGARDMLAAAYVSAGRYQDGVDQFTEALKILATDRSALLGRGIAYYQLKQYDNAAKDLQTFITQNSTGEFAKQDPQLERAYYQLGVVQAAQEKWTESVNSEIAALKIDAGNADALYQLGVGLIKTGDPAKAARALQQAVAFVPTGWCEPYQAMVDAYTAQSSADGTAYAKGMVAMCTGDFATAAATLKPLATSKDFGVNALLGLALTAARSGDNPGAAAYYNQVLAQDPKNQSAIIGLSQLGHTASAAPDASQTSPASPAPSESH
ncbi:MAG: tetratricopeptide repeat protein [Chloroflexota bacterium]